MTDQKLPRKTELKLPAPLAAIKEKWKPLLKDADEYPKGIDEMFSDIAEAWAKHEALARTEVLDEIEKEAFKIVRLRKGVNTKIYLLCRGEDLEKKLRQLRQSKEKEAEG